ncbi:hypothetical protein [Methylopila turkensis]|uniref:Uncharacterized protein n=1 Tax=Methylopila turkensis TaxID=1437816 RepID=A0A9W6JPF6_9HYPH|nr:hypothetical protein [Methylopila turkensis]GLK80106.1 hypothetical protein GCM10008174_18470 [Methylopila turkensis]
MDAVNLERLWRALGENQTTFGRRLEMSQPMISRALKGKSRLRETASRLAFELADTHAPEIARDARLQKRAAKALEVSEPFRQIVLAALDLIHIDE